MRKLYFFLCFDWSRGQGKKHSVSRSFIHSYCQENCDSKKDHLCFCWLILFLDNKCQCKTSGIHIKSLTTLLLLHTFRSLLPFLRRTIIWPRKDLVLDQSWSTLWHLCLFSKICIWSVSMDQAISWKLYSWWKIKGWLTNETHIQRRWSLDNESHLYKTTHFRRNWELYFCTSDTINNFINPYHNII